MGVGFAFTVTMAVAKQLPEVYEMVVVPVRLALAVTIPVAAPTEAIVPDIFQVPPGLESDNVVVEPWQMDRFPFMAAETPLTVMVNVPVHPAAVVYVIAAVPLEIPVTTPAAETPETAVAPELHVPPATASCNKVVPPVHIVAVPVIVGKALTVMMVLAVQPATPDCA